MSRFSSHIIIAIGILLIIVLLSCPFIRGEGEKYQYRDFQNSKDCRDCHGEIHNEWARSAMAKAYILPWDQEEYFRLALPHSKIDEKIAGVACDLRLKLSENVKINQIYFVS